MKHATGAVYLKYCRSPPVRGAWIETCLRKVLGAAIFVAPRAGGVD